MDSLLEQQQRKAKFLTEKARIAANSALQSTQNSNLDAGLLNTFPWTSGFVDAF
jgi:hypothetical protein